MASRELRLSSVGRSGGVSTPSPPPPPAAAAASSYLYLHINFRWEINFSSSQQQQELVFVPNAPFLSTTANQMCGRGGGLQE